MKIQFYKLIKNLLLVKFFQFVYSFLSQPIKSENSKFEGQRNKKKKIIKESTETRGKNLDLCKKFLAKKMLDGFSWFFCTISTNGHK
jgi:hypothetical protein